MLITLLFLFSVFWVTCHSSNEYYCENSDITITDIPDSFRISLNINSSVDEKSLLPVFEIERDIYHVWGTTVLHYCQKYALTKNQCFEVFSACKQKIQSMDGNLYLKSLKQPPTQHESSKRDLDSHLSDRLDIVDQEVAIIGANGYIGSYLHQYLLPFHRVTGYDRFNLVHNHSNSTSHPVILRASGDISDEVLQSYDVIVYLGGFTGRKDCLAHSAAQVFYENIWDPFKLASRMKSSQLLLFSSTSAVSEGSGSQEHREDSAIAEQHLDVYSQSLFEREVMLDQLSASHLITDVHVNVNVSGHVSGRETPRMVGLRFGSVMGYSRSPRINLAYTAMLRHAYTSGYIRVIHPHVHRAILGMNDLGRALKTIIQDKSLLKRSFDIFNLKSFNCNIEAIAVEVSSTVSVPLIFANVKSSTRGFSLDSTKMIELFSFRFHDTPQSVLKILMDNFPFSVMAQGVHKPTVQDTLHSHGDSVPCQVCGNAVLQQVLDLHHQPLANSFMPTVEAAEVQDRYPLRLMRCPVCNHVQLSHIVERNKLFQYYLYQSNTSSTLLQYFDWLTEKIIFESTVQRNGTVIEIACNDGSQLDSFRTRGWHTFGVDPARNLIPHARSKGHTVLEGFWGSDSFDMNQLPSPDQVDAIVAQNVLAHVEAPVEFLKACAAAMGPKTKLYIQTSQCEMIIEGQFDTAYHEHVSFFSAHSFAKAAQLAGLHVSSFEETPVHGISCLVTFELPTENKTIRQPGVSVVKRLEAELALGISTEVFYNRFEVKARQFEMWIVKHLSLFVRSDHVIGGYGAAAKGIVMLHFIQKSDLFSFIVDDAPLKKGLYCPGTKIPVWSTTQLASMRDSPKPLVLVIFAWNFWTEVSNKIHHIFQGSGKTIICVVPFPIPTVIHLNLQATPSSASTAIATSGNYNILASLPKNVFSLSHPSEPKIVLIMHFYNAEVLLPYWIANHAPLCDEAILIDYHSTDHSVSVIHRTAPSSWRVVSSRNEQQDISNKSLVNDELLWYAQLNPEAWIVTMEVSEFLVSTSLRNAIKANQGKSNVQKDNEMQIPKLYAFSQQGMTLGKHERSSLSYKHSKVGILSSNPLLIHDSFSENVSIPQSIMEVYESTIDSNVSYRRIHLGSSSAGSIGMSTSSFSSRDSKESISHLDFDDESVCQDVFIIDYVWQSFDLGNGERYCPLANKLNSDSTVHLFSDDDDECFACSCFPGHLLDTVDLSDIHNNHNNDIYSTNGKSHHDPHDGINVNKMDDNKLKYFIKTYQDTMFAFHLDLDFKNT